MAQLEEWNPDTNPEKPPVEIRGVLYPADIAEEMANDPDWMGRQGREFGLDDWQLPAGVGEEAASDPDWLEKQRRELEKYSPKSDRGGSFGMPEDIAEEIGSDPNWQEKQEFELGRYSPTPRVSHGEAFQDPARSASLDAEPQPGFREVNSRLPAAPQNSGIDYEQGRGYSTPPPWHEAAVQNSPAAPRYPSGFGNGSIWQKIKKGLNNIVSTVSAILEPVAKYKAGAMIAGGLMGAAAGAAGGGAIGALAGGFGAVPGAAIGMLAGGAAGVRFGYALNKLYRHRSNRTGDSSFHFGAPSNHDFQGSRPPGTMGSQFSQGIRTGLSHPPVHNAQNAQGLEARTPDIPNHNVSEAAYQSLGVNGVPVGESQASRYFAQGQNGNQRNSSSRRNR
ncbi:hypothetical protein O3S80_02580 [Streptomyces sp. Lzd4kr]|nr:hypothetical protein [Streptomyces sp. Lzd4kr]